MTLEAGELMTRKGHVGVFCIDCANLDVTGAIWPVARDYAVRPHRQSLDDLTTNAREWSNI